MSTNTLTQLPLPKKIKSPKDLPLIENFILSGITATIAKTIAAPIERVKILLQTQFILNDLNKKYKGNIDCLQRIYTEQGFTAFWRGNMANLIRYVPNFALSYSFKEYFKKYIEKNHFSNSDSPITKKQKYFINILSASLAGASSIILTYPLDLTRTVMAADVKSNKNKLCHALSSQLLLLPFLPALQLPFHSQ